MFYVINNKICVEDGLESHKCNPNPTWPCVAACPQGSFKIVMLGGGDQIPKVVREKCNECGDCFKVCRANAIISHQR